MEFRILSTYSQAADKDLPTEAQSVINNMTGNANFPAPTPALADVEAARDAFEKSIALAKDGGTKEVNDKRQKRTRLETLLRELAAYVIVASKNDPEIIASSGFAVSKSKGKRVTDTLSIISGVAAGQVISTMWLVPKTRMYVHQYTPYPITENSVWQEVYTGSRKHVHTGLVSGQRYGFRSKAISFADEVVSTDVVEWVVQ
jgi:hypothetical protein